MGGHLQVRLPVALPAVQAEHTAAVRMTAAAGMMAAADTAASLFAVQVPASAAFFSVSLLHSKWQKSL